MLNRAGVGYNGANASFLPQGAPTQLDREDLRVTGAMKQSLDGWGRVWPEEDWNGFLRKRRRKTALPQNGRILETEMTEALCPGQACPYSTTPAGLQCGMGQAWTEAHLV